MDRRATTNTRVFEQRLMIRATPWLARETWEDLQLCLRYTLGIANQRYSMETQPQQWFGEVLATLNTLHFTVLEHTHRTQVYAAHRDALKDVYEGYLPPPRAQGPWFKDAETALERTAQSAGCYNFRMMNASSCLSIELDCEADNVPVAILFYVYCVTDPGEPATKLNLVFDHLGARFDPQAFASLRAKLEAYTREQLLAYLNDASN